jgi:hypothetical protein
LEDAGRLVEAVVGFEVTLGARRRVLSDDHPDTLRSADDVVRCYRVLGRREEADALAKTTLAIRRDQGTAADQDRPDVGSERDG